ncbi:hypothetical protein A2673_03185 [Candidatus Kaiserbacteria bacterium RIFCSPHIGHO2_01_FULL_50_13]|nr:MAG: hypothetical protein A2673_03185 [Candidatus Kaiserbacteria bacterium RIFCSPHIGHO2_01_FULL_50_13]
MIKVQWLGLQPLSKMEAETDRLVAAGEERILLFEPFPAFRYSHIDDLGSLRVSSADFARYCKKNGINIVHTHDGGGLLYHGLGQLVMYTSLRMPQNFHPHNLRNVLQDTMIRFLEGCAIAARANYTVYGSQGVWVEDDGELRKIGFLGARFSLKINGEKIISRGCVVNLSTDLAPFELINPCNLPNTHVSSVERLTGSAPKIDTQLAHAFSKIFVDVLGEHLGRDLDIEYVKYA